MRREPFKCTEHASTFRVLFDSFRYYSVVYPLENKITMYKGKLMILYVWLHAVVISLPKAVICQVKKFSIIRMPIKDLFCDITKPTPNPSLCGGWLFKREEICVKQSPHS